MRVLSTVSIIILPERANRLNGGRGNGNVYNNFEL